MSVMKMMIFGVAVVNKRIYRNSGKKLLTVTNEPSLISYHRKRNKNELEKAFSNNYHSRILEKTEKQL